MVVERKKIGDLHRSLLSGGYEVLMDAEPDSVHYVWLGNRFARGICTGEPRIGVPIGNTIPNLLEIIRIMEETKKEPIVYLADGVGVGLIFPDIKKVDVS
jgi:hypothetical protein